MIKPDCDFNLGLDPNSIEYVLPKCKESFGNQPFTHNLIFVPKLDTHLSSTKSHAESSAYNRSLLLTASDISLT